MKQKWVQLPVFLTLALLLFSGAANATILAPGATVTPTDIGTLPGTDTLMTSETVSGTAAPVSATVTESVYQDTSTGFYDFVYQFTNTGTSSIEHINGSSYDSYATDVYFYTTNASQVTPITVDRASDGTVVEFNFTGSGAVPPGQTSALLLVRTNSKTYGAGVINLIDGNVLHFDGFSPTPEPGFYGVLAAGLGILFIAVKYRKKQTA